jgi:hypothetical protein
MPLVGTSEQDLRSIKTPTCLIPGNDRTHVGELGAAAARLMPDCELHRVTAEDRDVDVTPVAEWVLMADRIGAIFDDFLKRRLAQETPRASRA